MDLDFLRYRQADLLLVSARRTVRTQSQFVGQLLNALAGEGEYEGYLFRPWAKVFGIKGDEAKLKALAIDMATCFEVYVRMADGAFAGATLANTRDKIGVWGKALVELGKAQELVKQARAGIGMDMASVSAFEAVAEAMTSSLAQHVDRTKDGGLNGLRAVSASLTDPSVFVTAVSDALPLLFDRIRLNALFPQPSINPLEGLKGRIDTAVEDLEEPVEEDPENPEAVFIGRYSFAEFRNRYAAGLLRNLSEMLFAEWHDAPAYQVAGRALLKSVEEHKESADDNDTKGRTPLMLSPKEMLVWSLCRLFDAWEARDLDGEPLKFERGSELRGLVRRLIKDVAQGVLGENIFLGAEVNADDEEEEKKANQALKKFVDNQWQRISAAYFSFREHKYTGIAGHAVPFTDRD